MISGNEDVEVQRGKPYAVAEAVRNVVVKLRSAVQKMRGTYEQGQALQYINDAKAVHQALVKAYHEVGNKKTASVADGEVKYSANGDTEGKSIKEQIINSLDVLNSMEPVAKIQLRGMGNKTKAEIFFEVLQDIKSKGMTIDKKDFGIITLTEDDINRGLDYVNSDAEYSAYFAIHRVLKRGVVIGEHTDHKNRNMRTVTIGAPIILDDERCNVGIALKAIKGYRYKSLRVVLWDGSKVDTKKETKATTSRMTDVSTGESRDITLASNDSLSQDSNAVKEENLSGSEVKFSFAGANADTTDMSALEKAKSMEQGKAADEEILRETGWYRGIDGKWRFEISDEDVEFSRKGDLEFRKRHPDYARYRELLKVQNMYALGIEGGRELTEAEQAEYDKLRMIWEGTFRIPGKVSADAMTQDKLESYFYHEKLYEAYPQLKNVKLVFDDNLPDGNYGKAELWGNTIRLNAKNNEKENKAALIHEIQHCIQAIEGFSNGASVKYWTEQPRIAKDSDKINTAEERMNEAWEAMPEGAKEKYRRAEEVKDTDEIAFTLMTLELYDDYPEALAYAKAVNEYNKAKRETEYYTPYELYRNTAGEIEARDASARMGMTEAERRESLPNRGDENTVFAEDTMISFSEENKKTAEEAVEGEQYSYKSLANHEDMVVTQLTQDVPYKDGKLDRATILDRAMVNVRGKKNQNNTPDKAYVFVKSIGRHVQVGKDGLRHGLPRKADINANATMQIGDIIENSIKVNELHPRENAAGGYVLLGVGVDEQGNYYPARIIVNEYSVEEIDVLDVLYAVNAKKKNQSPNGAGLSAEAVPLIKGPSTIKVSELLNLVKENFADVLSEDVLREFGITRPKSTLSDSVKFSMPAPVSQAQYEDRTYKLERDIRTAIEEKVGNKLSAESAQAVQGLSDSVAKGDEAKAQAWREVLRDSILKNDMVQFILCNYET